MKTYLFALILVLCFGSCEKDSSDDESTNPEDKEWFKNLKSPCDENTICKLRINEALYENNTVYFTSYTGALCDMYFTVSLLNIDGDTIKNYSGPGELEAFNDEVEFVKTIYSCEDD